MDSINNTNESSIISTGNDKPENKSTENIDMEGKEQPLDHESDEEPKEKLSKEEISYNPNLNDCEDDDELIKKLRGDAISETVLYSERFVISTLLKLREMTEPLEKDNKFERDLEALWDMTIENDVVLKLIELDVYEIFMHSILKYHNDERLVEILVGIIGNMCTVAGGALEKLCKNEVAVDILIQLMSSEDSCILIQLMRLITTTYGNDKAANIWNLRIVKSEDFLENFSFLLLNSNNENLLSHSLETLNAILAKSAILEESKTDTAKDEAKDVKDNEQNFLDVIAQSDLMEATIEALQTLVVKDEISNNKFEHDEFAESEIISEKLRKNIIIFLNINNIFLQYVSTPSGKNWDPLLEKSLLSILNKISTPGFIKPSTADFLQDVLDSLVDIYQALPNLRSEENAYWVLVVWESVQDQLTLNSKEVANDFEKDDIEDETKEEISNVHRLVEELLQIILQRCQTISLERLLRRSKPTLICKLLGHFHIEVKDYAEEDLVNYSKQLTKALHEVRDKT